MHMQHGDQTVEHLLMHCTKLDQQRKALRTSIIKKEEFGHHKNRSLYVNI